MLIRNARPWGGPAADVEIADGVITGVRAHDPQGAAAPDAVEGRGRLLLPAFSDVHVHLDSTRIGLPFREHTGSPGVWGMMLNDRNNWRDAEIGLPERVAGTLERMIANGTTRVRSYAQVDVDCGLEKFDAVLAAKEAFAEQADVQIMTFPQAGILREPGTVEVLEESLRQGADVMGGIDPSQLDRDPAKHLDIVFGLAEKYQVEVDIHLHEPGELGVFSTELILERTRALGMQGKVTLSHAYELGSVSEAVSRRLIEEFAELDIAMATVAPAARRPLSLLQLVEAGVRVGLGEDGQRDYWSPYGNCDMLDRTWQLAFTNGFRRDEHIELALAVATLGGASIMSHDAPRVTGLGSRQGLAVGDRAELLLVDGETPTSAVMDRGVDRTVIHNGRVVADGLRVVGR
ncbi:amidohydrolase family protein [Microterricola viridarii]|uniref:N-isopropylammelide isopropylaminohydrolase n=1 Tax=Microterricola viridarii TaxID=412690 RepID=A0A109QXV6_9MICO|nr:amidohydrolase family protein [Microterricola viridarii]AMB59030.1 N-isopropylammelide isopropylaminohydrolase [Microterricola viridarii]